MSRWNSDLIPDQHGRRIMVTGANSGIGFYIAKALAHAGAEVIMACRNMEKARLAKNDILGELPHARLSLCELDLASQASVRQCAADFQRNYGALDCLINNAGVMALPRQLLTLDGFEMHLAANHLGHFALTGLLLPCLNRGKQPRVISTSSVVHKMGRIDFTDLQGSRSYTPYRAYNQSKLANLMFMLELDRRAIQHEWPIMSLAVHPGLSNTNIKREGLRMQGTTLAAQIVALTIRLIGQPAEQGALPTLYAATMPDAKAGQYWGPDSWMESRGYPALAHIAARAHDPEVARRLWEVSEELTGVRFA